MTIAYHQMPQNITILGEGAMATVCSILLSSNGHRVTMWGAIEQSIERLIQDREQKKLLPGVSIPKDVKLTANDDECFEGAEVIVSAIPCQYMRASWERLKVHVPKGVAIVSVAKGIETQTLLRPTQVISNIVGNTSSLAVLSGPNIAAEIARYLPATAVAASGNTELASTVQSLFTTPWFRVYTNDDIVGVEIAGAAKNVIALAAGIIDGLGAGNNAKAALVARGLVEITRLGVRLGAKAETFQGLAGLGDLITTCISPEGRNRSVGERVGKGEKIKAILASMDSVAEGVPTTQAVHQMAKNLKIDMPITQAVYQVLFEEKDVLAALSELMSRDLKSEI